MAEAAAALRRVLDAVERGELGSSAPREVALVRRLEGVLAGWEEALGEAADDRSHGE